MTKGKRYDDELLLFGVTMAGLILISTLINNLKEQPDPRFAGAATVGKECGDSVT